jgi:SRSO17 transposase
MGRTSRVKRDEWYVSEQAVATLLERLTDFLGPYFPLFGRRENHEHARMYVEGRLRRVERRTLEPIANEHGVHRRPLQYFVGAGLWEDEPVRDELCEQIARELGTRDGVLIVDASGFPKKGDKSVGVQRQWCGRLGKEENCQVGEFLGYASPKGHTLVDCRLYLPQSWASDRRRRDEAHVPKEACFRKGWELAHEMIRQRGAVLPHRWVVGDDAYGHPVEFRNQLDTDGERYLLEVGSKTQVRLDDGDEGWQSVKSVANALASKKWTRVRTRDGEKGPVEVQAVKLRVTTRAGSGKRTAGRRETLLITQRGDERWYYLSNARGASVAKMAKVAACRHYVEQSLGLAKGDVGLDEYEVRSWIGWHHHMTLSLLSLCFLVRERLHLKKRHRRSPSPRSDGRSPASWSSMTPPMLRSPSSPVGSRNNFVATNRPVANTGAAKDSAHRHEHAAVPRGAAGRDDPSQ